MAATGSEISVATNFEDVTSTFSKFGGYEMKITYNFVNGESVEIEVNEEVGKLILDMRREEETGYRKNRCYELYLETSLDHSEWNKYVQPEFDPEVAKEIEQKKKNRNKAIAALETLSEKQKELIEALHGEEPIKAKEYAELKGVTPAAISQQKKTIEKKLKKFIKKP